MTRITTREAERSVLGLTPRTRALGVPVLLIGLGVVLRIWGMDQYVLDGDEIFSFTAASLGWADLIERVATDVSFPPLYYLLLKLWMAIGGDGLAWTRLLSVLLGSVALAMAAPVCSRLGLQLRETALVLFLLAVNGFLIFYAQHLRAFVLLQLLSSLSLLAFLHLLQAQAGSIRQAAIALTLVNVLLVYAHYWGWLFVGGQGLCLLVTARHRFWTFFRSSVVVLAAFVPWVIVLALVYLSHGSLTEQISWINPPTPFSLIWFVATLNGVLDIPHSTTVGLLLFGIPVTAWALLAIMRHRRGDDADAHRLLLLALLASVVPLLTYLASVMPGGVPVYALRHLTPSALPYLILVSISVWRAPPARFALTLVTAVVLWAAVSGAYWQVGDPVDFPKKFRTEKMVAHVRANDPTDDTTITIYGTEGFTTKPLRFHGERMPGRAFDVRVERELSVIGGDHFWFVHRDLKWQQPTSAAAYFTAGGYTVSSLLSERLGNQTLTIFFVQR